MGVVWDTNVFISTLILHGRSAAILAQALWGEKFKLLVSEPILAEYFDVAIRPRFRSTREDVRELLERLSPWMRIVHPLRSVREHRLRDPDDLKFLTCAVAGHARYLVTGDKDLLDLERHGQVTIVPPRSFLKAIQ